MIIKGFRVSENPKHKSQKRRPVAIGLNGDFISQLPIISNFIKSAKAWSTFAESRVRHELNRSSELDSVPELIVEFPIMSDSARSSTKKFDPENNLGQILC